MYRLTYHPSNVKNAVMPIAMTTNPPEVSKLNMIWSTGFVIGVITVSSPGGFGHGKKDPGPPLVQYGLPSQKAAWLAIFKASIQ